MNELRRACEEVLRANDRGTYTVPSPQLYPHQWAWDSALAAVGWAHVAPARAWTELETLLAGQWDDGRVPHIVFHDESADYFPGPDFWGTERSSSITQPPVWATCARAIGDISGDHARAAPLLGRMAASHRFFHRARDPLGWRLVAVVHPWESGLDNCPAWDAPLSRVDVSDPPVFRRRDKNKVGDPSVRPTDEHYLRYACLVKAIEKDAFGPGPFAVYDPLMSAILARAEDDLAWLAERAGMQDEAHAATERAADLRAALVEHLWDEELGRFVYHDARAGEAIRCDVIGGYLPLVCGIEPRIAERLKQGLAARYATAFPLPSTAPSDPAFDPRRYWRGPSWININWLLAPSLGDELVRATIAAVKKSGFREYYQPHTGEGLGATQFAWTAALTLDLLARA